MGPRLESDPVPTLSDRASADLRFIRSTMESASSFAFPGRSWIAMGVTALAAARIASLALDEWGMSAWLIVWGIEAFLGASLGFGGLVLQSRTNGSGAFCAPACRFAAQLLPNLFVALVLTAVFQAAGMIQLMPALWCLLYGAAIVSARPVQNAAVVRSAGLCFILCGVVAFCLPAGFEDLIMASSFGGIHAAFGFWMARRTHGTLG